MSSPVFCLPGKRTQHKLPPCCWAWIACLLLASLLPVSAEDWTTEDGHVYHNVTVLGQEDDGVRITYDGGVGKSSLLRTSGRYSKAFWSGRRQPRPDQAAGSGESRRRRSAQFRGGFAEIFWQPAGASRNSRLPRAGTPTPPVPSPVRKSQSGNGSWRPRHRQHRARCDCAGNNSSRNFRAGYARKSQSCDRSRRHHDQAGTNSRQFRGATPRTECSARRITIPPHIPVRSREVPLQTQVGRAGSCPARVGGAGLAPGPAAYGNFRLGRQATDADHCQLQLQHVA